MKKYLSVAFIAIMVISCNNKDDKASETPAEDSTVIKTDSTATLSDSHYFWEADLDPKKGLVMKRTTVIPRDSLSAANIVGMMNSIYPEVPLTMVRMSADSVMLRITKSNYLTQQMGSSGAEAYLAEVTYNLTEVPGINFVDIRFKEGDHGAPGTFTRTDFIQVPQ